MRHCNKCNRNLPENKFGKNGNGSRSICKDCQCERIKQGQRKTRDYIQSLKTKCSRCGYDKCVEALDFHHTNPQEKDGILSRYGYVYKFICKKNSCIRFINTMEGYK